MLVEQRVSVGYTADVRRGYSDVLGLVQLAIREANDAYQVSRVPITLVLSDFFESDVPDSSDSAVLLNAWRALKELRSGHMAILLSQNIQSCGRAFIDCAKYDPLYVSCPYGVVRAGCATGYYSFAHEIGHIQGLDHNEPFDNPNSRFLDNHGYIPKPGFAQDGAVRTIMAYPVIDELRVGYFSNPDVKYKDKVIMGLVDEANSARVLTETRYEITRMNPNPNPPTPLATAMPTSKPTKRPTKRKKYKVRRRRRRQPTKKPTLASAILNG
jgi:hypothetical protein